MFCRNCANKLTPSAIACTNCGVPPMEGNKYCFNCAAPTDERAIICVKCGVGFQKPKKDINLEVILHFWNAFPYSTYIIILLFSLLPFINLKCGDNKIESITGLDMAIGKQRTYTKVNPNKYEQYGMEPYGYQKYTTETENLFTWDFALFYLSIIFSIYILSGSESYRFKIARNLTIVGLLILIEWFIVVTIRKSNYENNLIEISFAYGYWLTLATTFLSLILIFNYSKQIEKKILNPEHPFNKYKKEAIIQFGLGNYSNALNFANQGLEIYYYDNELRNISSRSKENLKILQQKKSNATLNWILFIALVVTLVYIFFNYIIPRNS